MAAVTCEGVLKERVSFLVVVKFNILKVWPRLNLWLLPIKPLLVPVIPLLLVSLWSPYGIGQTIIFLPCGYFFLPFFSSPNLSGRRLDVCHTSTHGVALVRISDAGQKPAARGSLKTQDAKTRQKSPSGHHHTFLLGYIFATKARIDSRKKLVKQQYVLHMSS